MPGAAPSYTNTLTLEEVSMALEHVLVAPYGTGWDRSAPIDVSSPPAGFIHLGAVQNDSPNLVVNKTKFQLFTGIPAVLAYEAVVQMAGEFGIVFHSNQNFKAYFGTGGAKPRQIPIVAHSPIASAAPAVTATTLSRTCVSVSTVTGFRVGMLVATDATSLVPDSYNIAFISAISGSNLILSHEGFPFIPVVGQPIIGVLRSEMAFGTRQIPYFHLLGVADFIDGAQAIHDLGRATPRGQWGEQLRVGQDVREQAMFDLQGYGVTNYTADSSAELALGERIFFFGNTLL